MLSAEVAANSLAHPLNTLVAKVFAGAPPTSLQNVAERYGKLFEDVSKRWQVALQSNTEIDILPDGNEEAFRQVFYGKDSPGNLPADLIRNLYKVPAVMQIGPLRRHHAA